MPTRQPESSLVLHPQITAVTPDAPHSLQVSIAGSIRQVRTTPAGQYRADFTASPYIAGLLGSMRYTTSAGDRVYKPIFVADPPVRGKTGDWRADVILGQPDFSQITPNEVVGNRLFIPFGVTVDRSVVPNRVYIYDSGNSRGLVCHTWEPAWQAQTQAANARPMQTARSNCELQNTRPADIVLGEPSFASSACNGDGGFQAYPDVVEASAQTLCGCAKQVSIFEGGSGATMATDAQGNLYVPDIFNNPVLRYDSPFTTDAIADYVWGQADFAGVTCNRGGGFSQQVRQPYAWPPGQGPVTSLLAQRSTGRHLWIADNMNHRVLRFPYDNQLGRPASSADLALGQPNLYTKGAGAGLPRWILPHRYASTIAGSSMWPTVTTIVWPRSTHPDNRHGRQPILGYQLSWNRGIEIDPAGGVWVNDGDPGRLYYFVNGVEQRTIGPLGMSRWNWH